ncbi:hypothetical protein TNCV_1510321 [Trichonephila clavipes]|nr:hypothetical protein TNCV_1510321 [Trichonephila clavipes]
MELACDRCPQLFVVAQTQEHAKISGSKIRALRLMIKKLPAKFHHQNTCCESSRMWMSIVMEEQNTCSKCFEQHIVISAVFPSNIQRLLFHHVEGSQ